MTAPGARAASGLDPTTLISASRFIIQIDGSSGVAGQIVFSELAGITSEVEPAEYFSSAKAGVILTKQFGKVKPATVTLKRGQDNDNSLWGWHYQVTMGNPLARANCSLFLQNTAGETQARYQLINAWPSKLEVSGMKAGASEVLIASTTLVCDQILIPPITGGAGGGKK
jgi:phage tail-like protein